jgi:2-phospho-L-lactate guanylyltransferase
LAGLSKSWIVVPVKALDAGKSRLRSALSDAARRDLVARMLHHVVGVADEVAGAELLLLGPSRHGLPDTRRLLADQGNGLNPALHGARAAAVSENVDRFVILFADLPQLTRSDVEALFAVDERTIAIATDDAGQGTNALSLPLAYAADFRFSFGLGSLAKHRLEAQRLNLPLHEIDAAGLAHDIDRPEDLATLPNAPASPATGRSLQFPSL